MRISTKGRYALRVMLDMAEHRDDGIVSLADIAKRQGISKNYLDQIMMLLKKDKFFKTTRGYQGGYKLARDPNKYSVGEILRVTEGHIAPVACLDDCGEDCDRSHGCMAMQVWSGLEEVMKDYLDNLTLQEIIDKYGDLESAEI